MSQPALTPFGRKCGGQQTVKEGVGKGVCSPSRKENRAAEISGKEGGGAPLSPSAKRLEVLGVKLRGKRVPFSPSFRGLGGRSPGVENRGGITTSAPCWKWEPHFLLSQNG